MSLQGSVAVHPLCHVDEKLLSQFDNGNSDQTLLFRSRFLEISFPRTPRSQLPDPRASDRVSPRSLSINNHSANRFLRPLRNPSQSTPFLGLSCDANEQLVTPLALCQSISPFKHFTRIPLSPYRVQQTTTLGLQEGKDRKEWTNSLIP